MTRKVIVIVEGQEYIVEVGDLGELPIRATVNGKTYHVQVPDTGALPASPLARPAPDLGLPAVPTANTTPVKDASAITAPMPGDIAEVRVRPGDRVKPGDVLCVLEAMKMKNMIHSPREGVIASVNVSVGQAVAYATVLVTFE